MIVSEVYGNNAPNVGVSDDIMQLHCDHRASMSKYRLLISFVKVLSQHADAPTVLKSALVFLLLTLPPGPQILFLHPTSTL